MNIKITGLLIVAGISLSGIGRAQTDARPPLYLQSSAQALSQGDTAKAEKILIAVREQDPKARGINYGLAVVAFSKGDKDSATSLLKKSIAASEMAADSHNLLGVIRAQSGQPGEAITEFEASIAVEPRNPQTYLNLAEALRADYEPKKAYGPLRKAIELDQANSATYAFKLRLAKIDAGDIVEVAAETEKNIKEKGADIAMDWVFTAAALSLRKGRMKEAAVLLDQARKAVPPETFANTMQDHAFKFFSTEESMAPFYK